MKKLTKTEVAALLRVRFAGRMDNPSQRGTDEEYREEQWAMYRVRVRLSAYSKLMQRGLVAGNPMRLTDAGREALASAPKGEQ